nr:hypothetical protein [Leucobacter exalbidus]
MADDTDNNLNDVLGASETPTAPLPTSRPAATGVAGAPDPGAVGAGIRRGQSPQPAPAAAPVSAAMTTPMPARQRLAHEQAERIHTAHAPVSKRSGGSNTKALPWVIVGFVAVVAIIVSIFVVNIARGSESTPEATPDTTETTPAQPETPSTVPEALPEEDPEPKPEEKPKNEAPEVEVGPTNMMPIGPWNATSDLSQRFGSASFYIPDGVNLELSSDLLNSFPASCADMSTAWGATKLDNGTFEVRKPAATCEAAPELYDEVWGLISAWVDSIKAS